jgi:hypothetical protein
MIAGARRAEDACALEAAELVTELVSVTVKCTVVHLQYNFLCLLYVDDDKQLYVPVCCNSMRAIMKF